METYAGRAARPMEISSTVPFKFGFVTVESVGDERLVKVCAARRSRANGPEDLTTGSK